METPSCPFCDFTTHDSYFLLQHVELIHPENGESPFIAIEYDTDQSRSSSSNSEAKGKGKAVALQPEPRHSSSGSSVDENPATYIECPYHCGELVVSTDLTSHTDLHLAENMAFEEEALRPVEFSTGACNDEKAVQDISAHFTTDIPKALRRDNNTLRTPTPRISSLKELLFGGSPRRTPTRVSGGGTKRLGRAELGPYAHESQMPSWLRRMLEEGAKVTIYNQIGPNGTVVRVEAVANETPGLVPVLASLSYQDATVDHAFYCSPEVHHVAKMAKEGGFCGYRNIQMMITYIREARAPGHKHFHGKTPSILKLQDMIENAWDMGFNSAGKIETGGIRLTRKYIGTPEAQALFNSLSIPCEANAFSRNSDFPAHESLLLAIGEYFRGNDFLNFDQKIHMTDKPPIYFQHQGHSMTIIGLEIRKSGSLNLMVFDPMFNPSPAIKKLAGSNSFRAVSPEKLLRAHRRGESYLEKYRDFEILKCTNR